MGQQEGLLGQMLHYLLVNLLIIHLLIIYFVNNKYIIEFKNSILFLKLLKFNPYISLFFLIYIYVFLNIFF